MVLPASFTEASTAISSPSPILPPGLPALGANDLEGESDYTLLPVPPQNFLPRPMHPRHFPGFMFFFLSFQIKTVLFTMVRTGAPPFTPPTPIPHTILYQRSHRELDEGLMWVKRGQG